MVRIPDPAATQRGYAGSDDCRGSYRQVHRARYRYYLRASQEPRVRGGRTAGWQGRLASSNLFERSRMGLSCRLFNSISDVDLLDWQRVTNECAFQFSWIPSLSPQARSACEKAAGSGISSSTMRHRVPSRAPVSVRLA